MAKLKSPAASATVNNTALSRLFIQSLPSSTQLSSFLRTLVSRLAGIGKTDELVDAASDGFGKYFDLVAFVVGGAEGVGELLVREAREDAADPARVIDVHVVEDAPVLAAVVEVYAAVRLDLVDELGLPEIFGLVAAARDAP